MSFFVPDFLANTVNRQVRRFSSNIATNPANDDTSVLAPPHHGAVSAQTVVDDTRPPALMTTQSDVSMSGAPIVASPIQDQGPETTNDNTSSYFGSLSLNNPIPDNANPATTADTMIIDDDVTDNPSFFPGDPFRTASPMTPRNTIVPGLQPSRAFSADSRRADQDTSRNSAKRNSLLPEDDGMREMRQKIIAIQASDANPAIKARLMHQLLTEEYNLAHVGARPIPTPDHPARLQPQEHANSPASVSSFSSFWQSHISASTNTEPERLNHIFNLTPTDLQPTFAPYKPTDPSRELVTISTDIEVDEIPVPVLGCQHYKRNVKMQCSSCEHWHTCRFCHDAVEDHTLIRKETKHMLCMLCGCAQKAAEVCTGCGARAAWYYCNVCKLWDDDVNKSIYHCDDCGICRIGAGLGKDFIHCKTCNVCIQIDKEHKCVERASDCDCPVCGDFLFDSPQTVVFMLCGHTIHQACYHELMKTSYKCPLCSQSVVNMETQFRNLDRSIEAQPMPEEFRDTRALVSCNDCHLKTIVAYHWLGMKCANCKSYNTAQQQLLTGSEQDLQDQIQEEDIIPGPRADLFSDTMARREALRVARENDRQPTGTGPVRIRRHSHDFGDAMHLGAGLRYSPYATPGRIGRSVSPLRGGGFFETILSAVAMPDMSNGGETRDDEDDDGEVMTFWGGESRRTSAIIPNTEITPEAMEGEEEESDSDASLMDEDDDEDEPDRMDLFGHR